MAREEVADTADPQPDSDFCSSRSRLRLSCRRSPGVELPNPEFGDFIDNRIVRWINSIRLRGVAIPFLEQRDASARVDALVQGIPPGKFRRRSADPFHTL